MKKTTLLFVLFLAISFTAKHLQAQVAITTDGSPPNSSAMLDVQSTTRGILPPRMTTAEMNSIATPANGLIVYNMSVGALYWFNGATWTRFNEITYTETDPVFLAHPSRTITAANITNWNTAFSWGNHAGLYHPVSWLPAWSDILNKPAFAIVATSGSYNDLINKPIILNSQWTTTGADIYYNLGKVGVGISNPSMPLHVSADQSGYGTSVIRGDNRYAGTNAWVYGVHGTVNSSATADGAGLGVFGVSSNNVGGGVGVYGLSYGNTGAGIKAWAASATGTTYGVFSYNASPDGYAGYFSGSKNYFSGNVGIGTANPSNPLHVTSNLSGSGASAAYIENIYNGTNPWIYGIWARVYGTATADNPAIAVFGSSSGSTGGGVGVWGQTGGTTGTGVKAWAVSATGVNYGVHAKTLSADGFAGYFQGGKNYFSGNVGIGTTNPLARLHVHDAASGNTSLMITPMALSSGDSSTLFLGEDYTGVYGMKWLYDGTGNQMELWGKAGVNLYGPHLIVNRDNGNVAIGSNFATGYLLSVSGKVICTEVRVNAIADWPDYVFKKGYALLPIDKLGGFIEEHGHLPNIPPASEIDKSGIDLGEMQRRMMEKIEEMSLYILGQQKQIRNLQEQLDNLKK